MLLLTVLLNLFLLISGDSLLGANCYQDSQPVTDFNSEVAVTSEK